jgi:hypothetical protein
MDMNNRCWATRIIVIDIKDGGTSDGFSLGDIAFGNIGPEGADDVNHNDPDGMRNRSIFARRISLMDISLTCVAKLDNRVTVREKL